LQKNITREEYERLVNLAGRLAIAAASLLIIVKLVAWIATGSSSILAALTDSLMDVTTSIINLLKPTDNLTDFANDSFKNVGELYNNVYPGIDSKFIEITNYKKYNST
jgi:ferrous-iron efflux pump FieF